MLKLTNEEFFERFATASRTVTQSVLKTEVLQYYVDTADVLLKAGKFEEAVSLGRGRVEENKKKRGPYGDGNVVFRRVRIAEFPLTEYLQWEMNTYLMSQEYGEVISIVEGRPDLDDELSKNLKDFILFDDKPLFINNYVNGELQGAYFADDEKEIAPYRDVGKELLRRAIPLDEFIKRHAVRIKP